MGHRFYAGCVQLTKLVYIIKHTSHIFFCFFLFFFVQIKLRKNTHIIYCFI